MAALAKLGARSVPVVVRGTEFAYGQDLDTVARFVGVDLERVRLDVPVLVSRLLALLDCAAHLTEQIPCGSAANEAAGTRAHAPRPRLPRVADRRRASWTPRSADA